jgi:hypothetical protein
MLKLFQSIVGARPAVAHQYERSLIEAAIDRALEATDPRVRSLSGHRRRLEPAVVKAIDHVVALADAMPPRKKVLGMAVEGDRVQQEVAQIQVSFDKHRLLDPSATAEEHRRLVLRRAFDQLLTLALSRISIAGGEHEALAAEQSVLRAKLRALQSAGMGLSQEGGDGRDDPATLEAKLADVEKRLQAAGSGAGTLPLHLDLLVDTLDKAGEQLRIETVPLLMDRLGIKQAKASGTTVELQLTEVRNAAGQAIIVLPVAIPRDQIFKRDVMADIRRELG